MRALNYILKPYETEKIAAVLHTAMEALDIEAEESYLAWPSCVAVLVTSMGCCYLCTCMAKIVRSDMERETMQYQKSYYQEIENSQQTVRSVRAMVEKYGGVMDVRYTDEEFSVTVCLMQNYICK